MRTNSARSTKGTLCTMVKAPYLHVYRRIQSPLDRQGRPIAWSYNIRNFLSLKVEFDCGIVGVITDG